MTAEIINQLMNMPDAEAIVDEVKSELQKEKQKRQEFYDWVTPGMKAEFINGDIIVHSPVKKRHNDVSIRILKLISDFVEENDLGHVGHEKLMIALTRNDYEADIVFFNQEKASQFDDEITHFPAPNLVVEILSSSETIGNLVSVSFQPILANIHPHHNRHL